MGRVVNPHDKFFKEVFSDKGRAVDFLESLLPRELVGILNLRSIEICKDSFVDGEFRESFSDLLYEVELADCHGYIYILFEHKSHPFRYTALQLLKYIVRIWELHLKQSPEPELPIILPLVLYQGVDTWRFGNRLQNILADSPQALLPYAPDFHYLLFDLSTFSDDQIRGSVIMRAMTLAMKYALKEELSEKLFDIMDLIGNLADRRKGLECLELVFRYLTQATDKLTKESFRQAVGRMPEGEEIMSTLAEQWFQEGKLEGKQEGKLEGKQEGRASEAREVILEIIEMQFGVAPQMLIEKLNGIQSYDVLKMLRRQMKNCQTIDDFAKLVERSL
jgi:predicted transposase/invertase (TIGR01784 family)